MFLVSNPLSVLFQVLPESFRALPFFSNIYQLENVPIATVMVRFNGWVTEMNDVKCMKDVSGDQSPEDRVSGDPFGFVVRGVYKGV